MRTDFFMQSDPDRNPHFRRRWHDAPADDLVLAPGERTPEEILAEIAMALRPRKGGRHG